MTPTIKESEMIIFQDDGSMIERGIYIIEYQIKFLWKDQKQPLFLISDNKNYLPIIIKEDEEIKIIGRVAETYDSSYRKL